MAKTKLLKDVKVLEFKGREVRCRVLDDNRVYLPVADLANIASVINYWDRDYGVYRVCPSVSKIIFYANKKTLWCIEPHDVEALCHINKRKLTDTAQALIEWAVSLPKTLKEPKRQSYLPVQTFSYNQASVTFKNENGICFINATEMAKLFGKRPIDWLRFQQAKEFIETLSKVRNHTLEELVQTNRGGDHACTWMHEDVALEFARWLNPEFAIWCNDRIKELITHGMTAMPDTIESLINDPELVIQMATKIKEERHAKELALQERDHARLQLASSKHDIERMQPKENYYDEVIDQKEYYSTYSIAGELGMTYPTLRKKLVKANIILNLIGDIIINPEYTDWTITVADKKTKRKFLKWTKEGRSNIFKIINPNMPK